MRCDRLDRAKMLLDKTDCTCVLCGNDVILTDKRRGVRPLLDLLNGNADVTGFSVADKVVGKAAAYLYCLLGIKELYAGVISRPALAVLERYHIFVEYGRLVPAIQNRSGDGPCPMESAVWEIDDPQQALSAILTKLAQI